jgi:hypothetical protein
MLLLFLALPQELQDIPGLGDFGKVDLGLDFGLVPSFFRSGRGLGRKVLTNLFRLIVLKRARVGLLLDNANFIQYIQNGFALYFKLSGQIIDSNFHPFCISSEYPFYAVISTSRL